MNTYTHATAPCAVLDGWAHLPPSPPPDMTDELALLIWWADRAQVHLDMRMAIAKEEERREEARA